MTPTPTNPTWPRYFIGIPPFYKARGPIRFDNEDFGYYMKLGQYSNFLTLATITKSKSYKEITATEAEAMIERRKQNESK